MSGVPMTKPSEHCEHCVHCVHCEQSRREPISGPRFLPFNSIPFSNRPWKPRIVTAWCWKRTGPSRWRAGQTCTRKKKWHNFFQNLAFCFTGPNRSAHKIFSLIRTVSDLFAAEKKNKCAWQKQIVTHLQNSMVLTVPPQSWVLVAQGGSFFCWQIALALSVFRRASFFFLGVDSAQKISH